MGDFVLGEIFWGVFLWTPVTDSIFLGVHKKTPQNSGGFFYGPLEKVDNPSGGFFYGPPCIYRESTQASGT